MSSTENLSEAEIAQFFQKRVRERIIYLLSSKKRGEIFGKLAHTAEDYIDGKLITVKSVRPLEREMLAERLGKQVYVIAEHSEIDGSFADIRAALDELWSCGEPYMLYGNGLLYVETEYDFSVHNSYLLKR